ncbi:MAG: 4Fe-4S binding protein [Bacteriovoracaceae bacterium]|jgi:Pyruvate/2-oxoacid:ferredoxin oxidoreductase delta subunit|nr:ferredoxin [Halobacteriovoraceae bacterium]MDP7321840.1 4Fe-4S binding protein [Bacteriovoracaceae bacterium]
MLEKIEINNTCISCDSCRLICPENSINTDGKKYAIDQWSCVRCGICIEVCPNESIKIIPQGK